MNEFNHITLGSLFDGIGGFPYAGSFFGIEPLWASEILPQAVSVTKRHFPEMAHAGDITALDGKTLPPVDIITFGSPCQDLSTAGKRAGLAGERSGLFMEAIRIVDEMRVATDGQYPSYAVWENVPGALSSAGGRDFQAVLESFTKTEIPMPRSGRWANAGMVRGDGIDLAWRILNVQYFGVPQRRRRIFLVCCFGAGRAGEILFVEKSLRGDFAPCGEARKGLASHAAGCAYGAVPGAGCLNPWDRAQSRVFTEGSLSPTLAGADGGGGRNPGGLVFAAPELARTLTARGDGSPSIDGGPNVVAVGVHQNQDGDVTTSESAYSLATTGNATSRNAPLVAQPLICAVTTQADAEICEELCPTITAAAGTSGNNKPYIVHPDVSGTLCASGAGLSRPAGMASEPDLCVAYALQGNMINRQERSGPGGRSVNTNISFTLTAADAPAVAAPIPIQDKATRHRGGGPTRSGDGAGNGLGVGKPGDPAPTVTAGDHHAVAAVFNFQRSDTFKEQDVASTQAARQYKGATDIIRTGYIVRRLTPTECERLQGFPDGWTAVGADGEPISDTRRYQMLGNSVAVPCVEFVLGNIAAQMSNCKWRLIECHTCPYRRI